MNKALFIDRDGVINYQKNGSYVMKLQHFKLIPEIVFILNEFRKKGYLIIIITNQSCVAKRLCTIFDINIINQYCKNILEKIFKIKITAIYVCPHHPNISECNCRKPSPYFVLQAISKYNIDPSKSYFIGDSYSDAECAEKAKIKNIIKTKTNDLKSLHNRKFYDRIA